MSTANNTATAGIASSRSRYADNKLSFFGVFRSETLKFRTLTTNWVMTLIIALVMIGLAILMGVMLNNMLDSMNSQPEVTGSGATVGTTLTTMDQIVSYTKEFGSSGIDLANMLIGSLAVVFIGSEYATHSMQTTITVVPKRSMVYLAKLAVLSIYGFVLGFVLAAISYGVGTMILDQQIKDATSFDALVTHNWIATGIYFVLMVWMGLGFGALLRNNAGGIMMVVVIFLILPIVLQLFSMGFDWVTDFLPYLPSSLGRTMLAEDVPDADISRKAAVWWFALWSAVPALLGYLRFCFTDSK